MSDLMRILDEVK